ncbi:MAG: class I SAM-dependent methyltransferase [Planctomycetota bacterium]
MSDSEIQVQDHSAEFYEEVRYKAYGLKYHSAILRGMVTDDLDGVILDVGCGTGIISRLYPHKDITGIDISEGMLKYHPGKCLRASADAIPFEDSSFDAVIGRSILHHLDNPGKALAEMRRVLKPGGKLVLWETNKSWLAQMIRRAAQSHERFSDSHSSFADLPSLVAEHFDLRQVRYQGFLAYPLFGFPDVTNFAKYMPLKSWVFWATFKFDMLLSRLPLIRKMAFAVRIKAQKPV